MVAQVGALQTSDLIFQCAGDSGMSAAITEATTVGDGLSFAHVGIVMIEGDSVKVIEACTSPEGVRVVPLGAFLDEAPLFDDGSRGVVVKRLTVDFDVDEVVNRALSFVGQPYDWYYLPDNGRMYCSELVADSFVDCEGNRIFEAQPMNFLAPDGSMPEFWAELFGSLGVEVPQGVLGTNPNDLSRDTRLRTVGIIQ